MDTAELRRRATQPWTAPIIAALRGRVAAAIARGVSIPAADELTGWAHNFTCSRCAVRLPFSWEVRGPFTCAACGNVDDGQDRREAWFYFAVSEQGGRARDAAVLPQLDGDAAARDHARAVLLGFARRYRQWPVHGRWAGKGRLMAQGLCEAVWLLTACETLDRLEWSGALSADEGREVREAMLRPAIDLLQPQIHKVHNIHVWMAAAVLAMAERCGDQGAAAFAREHLAHNLERGVLADGSWYEASPHYHYYTCEALLAAMHACRRLGTPGPDPDAVRRMLRAPLALLKPDGHIALVNDGWPENPLTARAAFYERAESAVGGMADVLAAIYRRGAARTALEALLHGPEALPEADLALPALAETDGIVTVRRGGLLALVKANPHGGGHDHRDQPTLDLHQLDGRLDAGDLGNPGYGNPLHQGWFKRTAAHNTVLVDGADHAPARPRVLEAEDRGRFSVVRVRELGAIPGGTLLRTVVVGDGWVLDRVLAELPAPGEALWRFHARADLACAAPFAPATLLANPNVLQQRAAPATAALDAAWTARSGGALTVRLWPPEGGAEPRFGAARAPALPASEHVDLLCAAARGTRLVFTACFAPDALPAIAREPVPGGVRWRVGGAEFVLADDGAVR